MTLFDTINNTDIDLFTEILYGLTFLDSGSQIERILDDYWEDFTYRKDQREQICIINQLLPIFMSYRAVASVKIHQIHIAGLRQRCRQFANFGLPRECRNTSMGGQAAPVVLRCFDLCVS